MQNSSTHIIIDITRFQSEPVDVMKFTFTSEPDTTVNVTFTFEDGRDPVTIEVSIIIKYVTALNH